MYHLFLHLVNGMSAHPSKHNNFCITFRRPNVFDVGSAVYKCFVLAGNKPQLHHYHDYTGL